MDYKRFKRTIKHFFKAVTIPGLFIIIILYALMIVIPPLTIYEIYKAIINKIEANRVFYCNPDFCPSGQKHIACPPVSDNWNNLCINPKQIEFTTQMKNIVVNNLNFYRNFYSSNRMFRPYRLNDNGLINFYDWSRWEMDNFYNPTDRPPCLRCQLIKWDNELEHFAQLAIKSCQSKRQICANTTRFPQLGQIDEIAPARPCGLLLEATIKKWAFLENRFIVSDEHYIITHELQSHVGCAMAGMGLTDEETHKNQTVIFLICMFSYAAKERKFPEASAGSIGGERCTTGLDPYYRNLCAGDEFYNTDKRRKLYINLAEDSLERKRIFKKN